MFLLRNCYVGHLLKCLHFCCARGNRLKCFKGRQNIINQFLRIENSILALFFIQEPKILILIKLGSIQFIPNGFLNHILHVVKHSIFCMELGTFLFYIIHTIAHVLVYDGIVHLFWLQLMKIWALFSYSPWMTPRTWKVILPCMSGHGQLDILACCQPHGISQFHIQMMLPFNGHLNTLLEPFDLSSPIIQVRSTIVFNNTVYLCSHTWQYLHFNASNIQSKFGKDITMSPIFKIPLTFFIHWAKHTMYNMFECCTWEGVVKWGASGLPFYI